MIHTILVLSHVKQLFALSSVHFSCSVVSNSLRPRELQHARPPCPSPTPQDRVNYNAKRHSIFAVEVMKK